MNNTIKLPLDNIEVMDDDLMFVLGGAGIADPDQAPPGSGTGCGCEGGRGCNCQNGSGCGCGCKDGLGCGCGCITPPPSQQTGI